MNVYNKSRTISRCIAFVSFVLLGACSGSQLKHDAAGIFEADEVIVSAELGGKILSFKVNEGDLLKKDTIIALIDALPVALGKEELLKKEEWKKSKN